MKKLCVRCGNKERHSHRNSCKYCVECKNEVHAERLESYSKREDKMYRGKKDIRSLQNDVFILERAVLGDFYERDENYWE